MAHDVVLQWAASPDASLFGSGDGYVVFKGSKSGGETTQVNTTPTTALTLTDNTVEPGDTFYVVKSSLGGVLSVASNEVSAVILPAPPANLVVEASA